MYVRRYPYRQHRYTKTAIPYHVENLSFCRNIRTYIPYIDTIHSVHWICHAINPSSNIYLKDLSIVEKCSWIWYRKNKNVSYTDTHTCLYGTKFRLHISWTVSIMPSSVQHNIIIVGRFLFCHSFWDSIWLFHAFIIISIYFMNTNTQYTKFHTYALKTCRKCKRRDLHVPPVTYCIY